ncbi:hypothetical protein HN643_06280 [Candidatus Falkowbacteria bacterium]|jgi:hypothetical protein|nr:hypothetical protein [Candidatus Falkowbacteria bacterium]
MPLSKNLIKKLETLDNHNVWELFAFAKVQLKERGLVRTENITGERGEFLAIEAYNNIPGYSNLQAAPEGTQNVDALSRKGERYSIKTITQPGRLTGVFYNVGNVEDTILPDKKFEYVIIVSISKALEPVLIIELTWEKFLEFRKWHKTMRAWNLSLTKKLMAEAKIIFEL